MLIFLLIKLRLYKISKSKSCIKFDNNINIIILDIFKINEEIHV